VRTEYVYVKPEIPRELTEEIVVAPREVGGLRDVSLVIADYVEAVERANIDRTAVACIAHPEELTDPRSCATPQFKDN
jgi:hypothetical protein